MNKPFIGLHLVQKSKTGLRQLGEALFSRWVGRAAKLRG